MHSPARPGLTAEGEPAAVAAESERPTTSGAPTEGSVLSQASGQQSNVSVPKASATARAPMTPSSYSPPANAQPSPSVSVSRISGPTPDPLRGKPPTRQELSDLFASIAPPREKRDEKTAVCYRVFSERGLTGLNFQGAHVCADLADYATY
jgi:hypothetical protein